MTETMDLLGTLKELVANTPRIWAEVDLDEQEYLDRLASFCEGYYDLSRFQVDENGKTDAAGA